MGLETVELVMDAEAAFGVKLPDEECSNVYTVGEFYELILRHISAQSSQSCVNREEVWRAVLALVSDQFGVDIKELTANTRFVEDLNG